MPSPSRPLLRWLGGKWHAVAWIAAQFPPHRVYVESFGGAASVLLRKRRSEVEVLNDLDDSLYALYRVARDPADAAVLAERLRLTLFSRRELELAFERCDPVADPIECARRMVVRGALGFGVGTDRTASRRTGFRDYTGGSRSTPAHDWVSYPECLAAITERLQGVIIENRDAVALMEKHDGVDVLHYVDPPYVPETRQMRRGYVRDMTDADHVRLLDCLRGLKGHVVLSGYRTALYDDALVGWLRVEREFVDQGQKQRTECLWLSPSCVVDSDLFYARSHDPACGLLPADAM